MGSASRLGKQIEEAVAALNSVGASNALIGGLALASHKVVRATQDVDLLADAAASDQVDDAILKLGYVRLHRTVDVANYLRGDERLDMVARYCAPIGIISLWTRCAATFGSSIVNPCWTSC